MSNKELANKYSWIIPLKDTKSIIITNAFQKTPDESNHNQTKYGLPKAVNFTIDQ